MLDSARELLAQRMDRTQVLPRGALEQPGAGLLTATTSSKLRPIPWKDDSVARELWNAGGLLQRLGGSAGSVVSSGKEASGRMYR